MDLITRRSSRGFSLIELLLVIVIIGILAGIAVPMFFGNGREPRTRPQSRADARS